ncbi:glycosyl transferase family 1 [Sphingobacterium sp. JUb56]|uniref:glycosyl transferase family 1 n=1 Tax=Sphingobacterium sp. JUb56 TaxID=2587145 RepID=UPI001611BB25|nr:glycosyl transferase family 1 [Sphingobacterium sp. JUb56]MBB2954348.1 glycosyltransferase involved in cell wall biosynthesis [Sphingobacterium sp. JUb56]
MVLFLAAYPKKENLKDGMIQRIASVDRCFSDVPRVYLSFSTIRAFKRFHKKEGDLVDIYRCHIILDFFFIMSLISKSTKIYIHSLYNVIYSLFYLLFFHKKYIFDAHGVVPEELEMEGRKFSSIIYNKCESFIFSRKKLTVVCVTDAMINHFKSKYINTNAKFVRYSIFPENIYNQQKDQYFSDTEKADDLVNIVYSGNTQKWQNIELMLKIIAENLGSCNYNFLILTGEQAKMQSLVDAYIPSGHHIMVRSVEPEELFPIYLKSHYGFVLRDDILVNNVACPTKLIEYLYYGITPIILSDNIGDFKKYGYESVQCFNIEGLKPKKSVKNNDIIQMLMSENNKVNLATL